jgi:hypothetical protein
MKLDLTYPNPMLLLALFCSLIANVGVSGGEALAEMFYCKGAMRFQTDPSPGCVPYDEKSGKAVLPNSDSPGGSGSHSEGDSSARTPSATLPTHVGEDIKNLPLTGPSYRTQSARSGSDIGETPLTVDQLPKVPPNERPGITTSRTANTVPMKTGPEIGDSGQNRR